LVSAAQSGSCAKGVWC